MNKPIKAPLRPSLCYQNSNCVGCACQFMSVCTGRKPIKYGLFGACGCLCNTNPSRGRTSLKKITGPYTHFLKVSRACLYLPQTYTVKKQTQVEVNKGFFVCNTVKTLSSTGLLSLHKPKKAPSCLKKPSHAHLAVPASSSKSSKAGQNFTASSPICKAKASSLAYALCKSPSAGPLSTSPRVGCGNA